MPLGTVHRHGAVKEPERRVTGALEEGTLGPMILSISMTRRTKIHTGSAILKNSVGYLVGHSAERHAAIRRAAHRREKALAAH